VECKIQRHIHIGTYDNNSTNVAAATTSDMETNGGIQGLINLFHTLFTSHVCICTPRIYILRFSSSFLKGKRPPARLRYSWKDIKMDIQEIGWRTWIGLIWLRLGTYSGKC